MAQRQMVQERKVQVRLGSKFDGQLFYQYDSPRDANGVFTERTP
jgi:hypothetical protein